ncbi:MAG: hypothetical protein L0216_07535 [Planctomycetales bacterium]|nr:hypothetical protein [Planctomycetales bacterium]
MGWMLRYMARDFVRPYAAGQTSAEAEERALRIQQLRKQFYRAGGGKASKDRAQDEQIAALQKEVDQVKLALASVMELLLASGALDPAELRKLLEVAESDEPDTGA